MNIIDTIKNRRSIRNFKSQDIPEAYVGSLIEAIRWAPSAGNLQSRKFFFVYNQDMKNKLDKAAGNPDIKSRAKKIIKALLNRNFIANAPLVVIACMDNKIAAQYGERGIHLYGIQDVAASVMNMMLTAHDLGLGSVWVGAFNEDDVSKIMNLSGNLRPVALIPIGYPAVVPKPTSRIAKEEIVEFVR